MQSKDFGCRCHFTEPITENLWCSICLYWYLLSLSLLRNNMMQLISDFFFSWKTIVFCPSTQYYFSYLYSSVFPLPNINNKQLMCLIWHLNSYFKCSASHNFSLFSWMFISSTLKIFSNSSNKVVLFTKITID